MKNLKDIMRRQREELGRLFQLYEADKGSVMEIESFGLCLPMDRCETMKLCNALGT